jgi:hypothetical protein
MGPIWMSYDRILIVRTNQVLAKVLHLSRQEALLIYRHPFSFKKDIARCPILVTWLRAWVR